MTEDLDGHAVVKITIVREGQPDVVISADVDSEWAAWDTLDAVALEACRVVMGCEARPSFTALRRHYMFAALRFLLHRRPRFPGVRVVRVDLQVGSPFDISMHQELGRRDLVAILMQLRDEAVDEIRRQLWSSDDVTVRVSQPLEFDRPEFDERT